MFRDLALIIYAYDIAHPHIRTKENIPPRACMSVCSWRDIKSCLLCYSVCLIVFLAHVAAWEWWGQGRDTFGGLLLGDTVSLKLQRHDIVHEIRQLVPPAWPVMVDIVSPIVKPCGYMFLCEYCVQLPCALKRFLLPSSLAYTYYYASTAVDVNPWMVVRHPLDKVLRRVGVCKVVVVIRESVSRMVQSAHGYERVKEVRTSEEEVGGMECP